MFDYPAVPALAAHLHQLLTAAAPAAAAAQSVLPGPRQLTSSSLSAQLAAAHTTRDYPVPMALTISSRTLPLLGETASS